MSAGEGGFRKLGIFHHPQASAARILSDEILQVAKRQGIEGWFSSPWDEPRIVQHLPDTDMLICVGGDGTVLRAARSVVPRPVPILGVNMGRLGFLCELAPKETIERLPQVLLGRYRIEQLTMLRAELAATENEPAAELYALNDVVVGRGAVARPVLITLQVEGVRIAGVRADGMIVATATGSTGYSLSAGGPVLPPDAEELIVTPVAPHLSRVRPLVLPSDSVLTISVSADHESILSVDGQVNRPLPREVTLQVRRSPYSAHLVRLSSPIHFYSRLNHYLDMASYA